MKPSPGVWGIDLGQCALKALRLQEIEGQLTATAFDYIEHPKILNQPDADPDQLTREALEQFLSRNSLRGDIVAISVPGQSGLARFVKLPPVEEKKIADIVKFEAKQQIPFNLDEVVWDFQKIGSGNVVDGFALETEIGLFAMKRDMVSRYLGHFKEVGVDVHVIQMAPLALCNYAAYDLLNKDDTSEPMEGKGPCVVALDMGTDSTNMIVTDGGKVIWQRPIPIGGNHFTRALTKEMKLTFAKAEHLKRNATKSGAPELKKILGTLKPVLNDFVAEVQRSLGFFTNTHRDAQIEYMVGLGNAFRLPGLQRFLAEKLQLEVRKIDKMQRLEGDSVVSAPIYTENLLSFGVAYGLALQGLKRAKLVTNLLPNEIRMERLIRAKKPWAAGAAGLLLAGLGAASLSSYFAVAPFIAEEVKVAREKADTVGKKAQTLNAAFETVKKEAIGEEDAVKAIVAGEGERQNWLHLMSFLSEAIPRPDGSNISDDAKAKYFLATSGTGPARPGDVMMTGEAAYKELLERNKDGGKGGADKDEFLGINDLIQFHIEAIDTRYTDDLSAYWAQATTGNTAGGGKDPQNVLPISQRTKKPEGKGWVVEVAGFTYHRDKDPFIRATLLDNLARMGIKEAPAQPGGAGGAPQGGNQQGGNQPAPQPAPATQPAADPNKNEEPKHPVINNISFVVLHRVKTKNATEPFEFVNSSQVGGLLGGGGGGGMGGDTGFGGPRGGMGASGPSGPGGPGGGMPGPGGPGGGGAEGGATKPTRSAWKTLSSRAEGASGSGGAGSGGFGASGIGGAGAPRPGSGTGIGGYPGSGPGPSGGTATGGKGDEPVKPAVGQQRTEFVILFIWQEPTPSDALRGFDGGGGTPK